MILLHICCGPCTVYPLSVLQEEGIKVRGFFYNPNIHPFREFRQRLQAARTAAEKRNLVVDYDPAYGLKAYLRKVVFHEEQRCELCYEMRLAATARHAIKIGAEAFSTTLLYSRYQKHELIRRKGEQLAALLNIPFYYRDFRDGWQEGIDMAIEMDLYRQSYCGCIYSEQERYDKKMRKQKVSVSPASGPDSYDRS
jgi:predicted adenine nucleotide alpha hydrolase (AANH) superfamily ATPase